MDIDLYGYIGGFDTDLMAVDKAIKRGSGDITLNINSEGGSALEGLAIYNRLQSFKQNGGEITTNIVGYAFSIASVIALAGDQVNMPRNAYYLIHNPHGFVGGDAEALRKTADDMDKLTNTIVSIYQDKTGMTSDDIRSMMNEDALIDAETALQLGFVDTIVDNIEINNAFDKADIAKMYGDDKAGQIFNQIKNTKVADKNTITNAVDFISSILGGGDKMTKEQKTELENFKKTLEGTVSVDFLKNAVAELNKAIGQELESKVNAVKAEQKSLIEAQAKVIEDLKKSINEVKLMSGNANAGDAANNLEGQEGSQGQGGEGSDDDAPVIVDADKIWADLATNKKSA